MPNFKFYQGPLPRREIVGMTRHQNYDKNEYIIRSERWMGLSASGSVITISVDNIDFTKKVGFEPDIVPIDPEQPQGATARIIRVGRCMPAYETAEKIYLTPFSPANVLAAMQKAQRPTESSLHGHISLALSKDGSGNPLTVPDLNTFTNASFDDLWKSLITPQPQVNINSKDLLNYVRLDREARENQEHKQYS